MLELNKIEKNRSVMQTLRDLEVDDLIPELRDARLINDLAEEFSMAIGLELVKDHPDTAVIRDLNTQLLEVFD